MAGRLDTLRRNLGTLVRAADYGQPVSTPMSGEIGGVVPHWQGGTGGAGFQYMASYIDTDEHVPELLHPESLHVYRRMCVSPQVRSLTHAARLPILGWNWYIEQGRATPETTQRIADNLGLKIEADGDEPDDRSGIDWMSHLELALDAPLRYGHAFFETVVEEVSGGEYDGAFWLSKLALRPQRTISGIHVNPDGSLDRIMQYGINSADNLGNGANVGIAVMPADKLLCYVNEPEPGDWYGAPLIRPMYEPWFYRDMLLRIDAIMQEKNAVGLPVFKRTESAPATSAEKAAIAAVGMNYRGGTDSYVELPYGYDLSLMGVTGGTTTPMDSVKYHDEAMARAFLAMILQLGQTETGSRALGDTFQELWMLGLVGIAKGLVKTQNQLVRRMVDWTEGSDAPAPTIKFDYSQDPEPNLKDLSYAVDAGLLQVDDGVRNAIRNKLNYPPVDPSTVVDPVVAGKPKAATDSVAGGAPLPLGPEGVTPPAPPAPAKVSAAASGSFRDLTAIEAAAGLDPAKLDKPWQAAKAKLIDSLQGPRAAAAAELVAQVKKAVAKGDLQALAKLDAGPVGQQQFVKAAQQMVQAGAAQAHAEAAHQGVDAGEVDLAAAGAAAENRGIAAAITLGGQLAQSAANRALSGAGAGRDAQTVADDVAAHLNGLSDAGLASRAQATLSGAMGDGRTAVQQAATEQFDGVVNVYSSAILDANCCSECEANDGTDYSSVDEADQDYPGGAQYVGCEGGDQCRCLTICVYGEAPATS